MLHLETIITLEVLNYPLWKCCLLLVSAIDFHRLVACKKKWFKETVCLCICNDDNHSCARPCLYDMYLFFTPGLSMFESFFLPS